MSRRKHRKTQQRRSGFEHCEPRRLMTAQGQPDYVLDYYIGGQSELVPASLAAAHHQTGMDEVRAQYGLDGRGQTVAVIDTGIAYDHAALGGGFGSGYRVVGGWDVPERDGNPYDDTGAHGTHVAGIIGSSDSNNLGVAPGVDLVALRVFDDAGTGYFSWVESALKWVYAHRNDFRNPITTVNLSLGASWNSSSIPSWAMLEDEFHNLESVGIFISVAAGNDFGYYGQPGLSYPAASPYVVPVMSTDPNGLLSYFSQRHERAIAAPGASIRSTVPDWAGDRDGRGDDFATYSGTSMAAPYVAGAAVILRQALEQAGRTSIDQDMIYGLMRDTADRIYDSATGSYYLRLNLKRAVDATLTDVEGDSDTPVNFGNLALREETHGTFDFDGDRDYLRFTGKRAGAVTITLNGPDGADTLLKVKGSDGSTKTVYGTELTFTVKAGVRYLVRVQSLAGTGEYDLTVVTTPKATNVGEIGAKTLTSQKVSGEKWYRLDAASTGVLTGQAWIKKGTKDVKIALYDSDLNHICTSSGRYTDRMDGAVADGEVYFVRLYGTNSNVKLGFSAVASESQPAGTQSAHALAAQIGAAREADSATPALRYAATAELGATGPAAAAMVDRVFGEASVQAGDRAGLSASQRVADSSTQSHWSANVQSERRSFAPADMRTAAAEQAETGLDFEACDHLFAASEQTA